MHWRGKRRHTAEDSMARALRAIVVLALGIIGFVALSIVFVADLFFG